jgi:hypothetical protein
VTTRSVLAVVPALCTTGGAVVGLS